MRVTIVAAIFAIYYCNPPNTADPVDAGVVVVEDEYPVGPYGWRAAIREIDGEFVMDTGSVFAPILMAEDRFDQRGVVDYWAVVVSYPDCVPCDHLWARWGVIQPGLEVAFGGSMVADKIEGLSYNDFEADTWPEMLRAYPTVLIVDLQTMVIIAESLHDYGLAERGEYWYENEGPD